MKLLQINTTANTGSHGRIAEGIGMKVLDKGHESIIAFGRHKAPSRSDTIRIGRKSDLFFHVLKSRLLDLHGFGSEAATRKFIKSLITINPDIIHLHNIHGYYLNVKVLFEFLNETHKPIVWTFHDCWPFTGHCSHFEDFHCNKWQSECFNCPNKTGYPASWLRDNSRTNFHRKKRLFTGHANLSIVAPSDWLAILVRKSFLKGYPISVINNGIDIDAFTPDLNHEVLNKFGLNPGKYILGVASIWNDRKGLADFTKLSEQISCELKVVLVGVKPGQVMKLSEGMLGIGRTESIKELSALYSGAAAFINPTYADNFPTTNLESLACGTPVITYDTGGSPETVDDKTGIIVPRGDIGSLVFAVETIFGNGKDVYRTECRHRAETLYDKNKQYLKYIRLYSDIFGMNL